MILGLTSAMNRKADRPERWIDGIFSRLRTFFGSSKMSGEGGADFEEEVSFVAVSIGHALDDLDSVVDPFEHAGV